MLSMKSYSEKEVEDSEKFMRGNVVTTANKSVMLHHLSVTRQSREKFVKNTPLETIISRYPILLTMNEAVGIFF